MSRLPIRWRLTAAFAAATVAVLIGAGWFVYARFRTDLNESVDATLEARWRAAAELLAATGSLDGFPLEDPEEGFVQRIDGSGEVVDTAGLAAAPSLPAGEVIRAGSRRLEVERDVPGIDSRARMLAAPLPDGGSWHVLVVGQSLTDRDEALRDLVVSFAIGGPVAVLLASVIGFLLARSALSPVEAMRATAAAVATTGDGRRLPVPATNDEIRRLAVTLNDMIGRLEAALARERRFVADASHELRTPIAILKTELEAARNAAGRSADVIEPLRAAVAECDSLAQLAEDLLILARDSESGIDLVVVPTPLPGLLEDARNRFVDRAAHEGRAIVVEAAHTHVSVDRLRLRQALSNLVDNALRHGRGTVTLRATANDQTIDIEVADEGLGLAPDLAARAFERFARGDRARAQAGAGLGLAIVEVIVAGHGGTVRFTDGERTTVRITLPKLTTR